MWFIGIGVVVLVGYVVCGLVMTALDHRNPGRLFTIGGYTMRRSQVTAADWRHRYLPLGVGGGLVLIVVGLVLNLAGPGSH